MNQQLDIVGQNARLSRLYTQLAFCFESRSAQDEVIFTLQSGLEKLAQHFPWTAGQTTFSPEDGHQIGPLPGLPGLVVKDGTSTLPNWQDLKTSKFPFSMLHEDQTCPRRTLPERFNEPAEVFLVQLTFVNGGFIITFTGQHNCMDIAGQVQVIRLLAKACRKEEYTDTDIHDGNLPRRDIIPLLQSGEQKPTKPAPPTNPAPESTEQSKWFNFLLSGESLAALKTHTMKSTTTDYISTDDALSALLWQTITRARLPRLDQTHTSSFQRQVDVRKRLDLPKTYTGMAVYTVTTTAPIRQVVEADLGVLASLLRSTLGEADVGYEARKAAGQVYEKIEKEGHTRPTPAAEKTLPISDVKISSWAKEECYGIDFGGGIGKPDAVRRPDFPGWEGLVYLLPRKEDGEIVAAVNVCEEDLKKMKEDEEFGRYAEYID